MRGISFSWLKYLKCHTPRIAALGHFCPGRRLSNNLLSLLPQLKVIHFVWAAISLRWAAMKLLCSWLDFGAQLFDALGHRLCRFAALLQPFLFALFIISQFQRDLGPGWSIEPSSSFKCRHLLGLWLKLKAYSRLGSLCWSLDTRAQIDYQNKLCSVYGQWLLRGCGYGCCRLNSCWVALGWSWSARNFINLLSCHFSLSLRFIKQLLQPLERRAPQCRLLCGDHRN